MSNPKINAVSHDVVLSLEEQLAQARAENLTLKKQVEVANAAGPGVSFKLTDKGGISAYGLSKFPVTLYKPQWLKLCSAGPVIEWIKAHEAEIDTKAAAWLALPEAERKAISEKKNAEFAAKVGR